METAHPSQEKRLDLTIVNKERCEATKSWTMAADHGVQLKERLEKYQELARELRKAWNSKIRVLPIIAIVFRTVSKTPERR